MVLLRWLFNHNNTKVEDIINNKIYFVEILKTVLKGCRDSNLAGSDKILTQPKFIALILCYSYLTVRFLPKFESKPIGQ